MPLIEAKALIPCKNLILSRKNKNREQESKKDEEFMIVLASMIPYIKITFIQENLS